jgi:hypothetical protein
MHHRRRLPHRPTGQTTHSACRRRLSGRIEAFLHRYERKGFPLVLEQRSLRVDLRRQARRGPLRGAKRRTDAEITDVIAFLSTLTDSHRTGQPPAGATSRP